MMPRLLMELCNKNILKYLGDGLDNFIDLDVDFHSKVDRKIIKYLVVLDL